MKSQQNDYVIIEIDDDLNEIEQMRVKQSFFTKHKVIKVFFLATLLLTAGFALISALDNFSSAKTTNRELEMGGTTLSMLIDRRPGYFHVGLLYENSAGHADPCPQVTFTHRRPTIGMITIKSDPLQRETQLRNARFLDIHYLDSSKVFVEAINGADTAWSSVPIGNITLNKGEHFFGIMKNILTDKESELRKKFIGVDAYNPVSKNCWDFLEAFVNELHEKGKLDKKLSRTHYMYHSAIATPIIAGSLLSLLPLGLIPVIVAGAVIGYRLVRRN